MFVAEEPPVLVIGRKTKKEPPALPEVGGRVAKTGPEVATHGEGAKQAESTRSTNTRERGV
jgi:hypothetical protein